MRVSYSPELRSTNKDSTSFRNSGTYTSPGTPDYGDNHGRGFQRGWCSERVPFPGNRRRASANILMPFNNGRTLPSKWDDAERWITSPVSGSGSGMFKTLEPPPPQPRPKSKSGPLGPTPGTTCFSPGFTMLEGGNTKNVLAGSPLTTGVLVPNGYSYHDPAHGDYRVALAPSASLPGWSEFLIESSYPDPQDEKIDENITSVVSRRDMATQMSPDSSPETSPKRLLLSTSPPQTHSPVAAHSHHSVRDVQVDKRVTMTNQPKRRTRRMEKNLSSSEINDLALTWDSTQGAAELSKLQKEEARIAAWENLQNAKAEASIRKLEMNLEKKKSASMDKIMKKLRISQKKAQEMRKNMPGNAANPAPRTFQKLMSLHRYPKNFLTCCFSSSHS